MTEGEQALTHIAKISELERQIAALKRRLEETESDKNTFKNVLEYIINL